MACLKNRKEPSMVNANKSVQQDTMGARQCEIKQGLGLNVDLTIRTMGASERSYVHSERSQEWKNLSSGVLCALN